MIPLPTHDYPRLLPRVKDIPINTLFAQRVLQHPAAGAVYVDRTDRPETFLVAHRCGLSLLAGNPEATQHHRWLRDYALNVDRRRQHIELVQPWPFAWQEVIAGLAGERYVGESALPGAPGDPALQRFLHERVIGWTRLNFRFDADRFRQARPQPPPLPDGFSIQRLTADHFASWVGAVMPREFWESQEAYAAQGVAFGVVDRRDERVASLAFSAFVDDGELEIAIETRADCRRRGLATHAARALVGFCLAKQQEPVWSCKKGNEGSRKTAEAAGFVLTQEIPYLALATA